MSEVRITLGDVCDADDEDDSLDDPLDLEGSIVVGGSYKQRSSLRGVDTDDRGFVVLGGLYKRSSFLGVDTGQEEPIDIDVGGTYSSLGGDSEPIDLEGSIVVGGVKHRRPSPVASSFLGVDNGQEPIVIDVGGTYSSLGGDSEPIDLEGSIVVGGVKYRRPSPVVNRSPASSCSCSRRSSCSCSSSSCSSRGYSPSVDDEDEEERSSRDDEEDLPFPGFRPVTFFCMTQTSQPRNACLKIVTNPWFERACMSVILLNCLTLGLYRPCSDADPSCPTVRCRLLRLSDHLIFGFFLVEMLIKMAASGPRVYLGETWNRLDFFIVVAGSLEYCLDMGNINLSAIRTVRVLRPLRAINRIPSLRILVMLLLDTLPMLGNVLLLCFFVFFIFGIVGVQMWAGLLRQRCYLQLPPGNATHFPHPGYISPYYYRRVKLTNPASSFYQSSHSEAERDYICSMEKDGGVHRCEGLPPTRKGGVVCNGSAFGTPLEGGECVNWNQYYTQCRAGDRNPFQGAVSFDNIGLAWVAIFLVISLEGWTDIMYYVQDAHSFWDFTYFVLLIVVGSFFMINLCLVVIATQFSETKKREMERMRLERARFRSSSTLASASAASSSAAGCYTQLCKYAAHLGRRGRRRVLKLWRGRRKEQAPPSINLGINSKKVGSSAAAGGYTQLCKYAAHLGRRVRRRVFKFWIGRRKEQAPPPVNLGINSKKVGRWHPGQSSLKSPESSTVGSAAMAPYASPEVSDIDPSPRDTTTTSEEDNSKGCVELLAAQGAVLAGNPFGVLYSDIEKGAEKVSSAPQLLFYSPETGECWSERGRGGKGGAARGAWLWWGSARRRVKELTDHRYFQRGILTAILVNTLSMGIEYHNQPASLTLAVEVSNVVFTLVFCLEMVLKVVAEGLFAYVANGFNLFDSAIVLLSLVELCQSSEGGGSSGLSVLRTFRLLRILKLVRFLPALRRQLVIMLRTVDNVAIFFALLILFIFIFSILGMNLFGCKFCRQSPEGGRQCDRKNFDSLLWAIVTVFQILTQEDWNVVLFAGMERTSHWAALYFVALMTLGNYVLFNLLVAILVEGFSSQEDEKQRDESPPPSSVRSCSLCEKQERGEWQHDPKDNIEKEIKMKAYVLRVVRPPSKGEGPPPLITHTAATPQGSPCATLLPLPHPTDPTRGRDKGQGVSPPDLVFQLAAAQQGEDSSRRSSGSVILALSRQSSIVSSISRKNSLGPCFALQEWRQAHHRRKKSESSENGSGSEDVVLNNMTSSHSPSPAFENGSIPTLLQNTPNNKRNSSVRSSSLSAYRHAHRASSPAPEDNFKPNNLDEEHNAEENFTEGELPPKTELLPLRSPKRCVTSSSSSSSSCPHRRVENERGDCLKIKVLLRKLCWFIKPKGWIKDREDYSLFLFSKSNWVRRACSRVAASRWFDSGILVFIASNCVTLAMERPTIPPDSGERLFLTAANYTFTAVFTIEMAVKVVSTGLWWGRGAYFRSGWNVMDGVVVGISLADFLLSMAAEGSPRIFGILRVVRLLRSLRPLRVINRAPGLKLVVQTLLSSLRPIGNIVLICCTFFVIFGILGVQLFKGSLYYCEGPTAGKVRTKQECLRDPRNQWLNRKYNFDNLGQALMSLFVLSSKDGWVNIMYTGLDAVGVDQQPIENYNEWRLLYFISFLLLVAFFVLNMFVGVVVENFHRCREQQEREERARRAEKRAKRMDRKRRKMRAPPYHEHYSPARLSVHHVITSKYFDLAIAAVIGLNIVTMAMEFYMMPESLEYALRLFNYFFTAVFVAEAALKVVALGIVRYLKKGWNQLDMGIVALSIAGIVLEEKMDSDLIPINPTIIRVFRVMRIARVLKLLKMAKGIRALLDTVMQALPQVGNLGLLFFLLFFIFAALGVELFGRLECTEELPCEGLGEHAHFKDFGMAFLTLFRVATGDNWNGIMKDALREQCDSSADCVVNCCVSPLVAPLYFVVFVLMAQFVLVNVVVAVLMKHLEDSHRQMDDDADIDAILRQEMLQEEEDKERKRRHLREQETLKRAQTMVCRGSAPTRPSLVKMASLPPDFVFPPAPHHDTGLRRASLNLRRVTTPVASSRQSPPPNVNIRQASPDESKVSVANLSPVPPPSPTPGGDDWACVVDSLAQHPVKLLIANSNLNECVLKVDAAGDAALTITGDKARPCRLVVNDNKDIDDRRRRLSSPVLKKLDVHNKLNTSGNDISATLPKSKESDLSGNSDENVTLKVLSAKDERRKSFDERKMRRPDTKDSSNDRLPVRGSSPSSEIVNARDSNSNSKDSRMCTLVIPKVDISEIKSSRGDRNRWSSFPKLDISAEASKEKLPNECRCFPIIKVDRTLSERLMRRTSASNGNGARHNTEMSNTEDRRTAKPDFHSEGHPSEQLRSLPNDPVTTEQ